MNYNNSNQLIAKSDLKSVTKILKTGDRNRGRNCHRKPMRSTSFTDKELINIYNRLSPPNRRGRKRELYRTFMSSTTLRLGQMLLDISIRIYFSFDILRYNLRLKKK